LLALPYALELNDGKTIIGCRTTASSLADMIAGEIDKMPEAARH
jgi:hypothetical protein